MNENEGSKPITVSCSDHHEMLVDGLWKFFQVKHRTDLMYFCGSAVSAHRPVVEVFLSPDKLAECYSGQKRSEDDLNRLIEFLYKGTVTVRQDQLEHLKTVAQELDLKILSDALTTATAINNVGCLQEVGQETELDMVVDVVDVNSSLGTVRSVGSPMGVGDDINDISVDGSQVELMSRNVVVQSARPSLFPVMSDVVGWTAAYHQSNAANPAAVNEEVVEEISEAGNRGPPVFVEYNSEYLVVGEGSPRVGLEYATPDRPWHLQVGGSGAEQSTVETDAFGWDDGGSVLSSTTALETAVREDGEPSVDDQGAFDEEPNVQYVFIVPKMEAATDLESDATATTTSQYDLQYAGEDEYPSSSAQWDVQVEEVTLETADDSVSVAVAESMRRSTTVRKRKRALKCDTCGKSFADRVKLDRHVVRTHASDSKRGYKCEMCGKVFKRRQRLAEHAVIHAANEKPYACEICGKRFKLSHHLRRHDLTHTEAEKNLKRNSALSGTSSSSKRLTQFKKTVSTHVFRCDECGKSLSDSSTLRRHRLTHTSQEKPFACPASPCSYRCNRRDNLRAHMRNVHKLNPDHLLNF